MTTQVLAVTAQAVPAQPFATHMIDGCVGDRQTDRQTISYETNRLLVIKQHDLNTDGPYIATSRNQRNVG